MGFGLKTSLRPRQRLPLVLSWQPPACANRQVCSGQHEPWVVGRGAAPEHKALQRTVWILQLRQASPLKSSSSLATASTPPPPFLQIRDLVGVLGVVHGQSRALWVADLYGF